jgi:uncharacterized RDD family membrane protein YckC
VTVVTGEVLTIKVTPARSYAGLVTRSVAFALDAALINLAALAVSAVVVLTLSLFPVSTVFRDVLLVIGAILFVLWIVAYFTSFWTTTGETPGCHAMRIRVIRTDGSRLRPRHALLRLVGLLLSFPLFWGFIPILLNDRRRGAFDALAGTLVINADTPDADPR